MGKVRNMQALYQTSEPKFNQSAVNAPDVVTELPRHIPKYPAQLEELYQTKNETNYNKRIYSPFLYPSSVQVRGRMDNEIGTLSYVHNVARTRYFQASIQPSPSDHKSVNLLA